MSSIFNRYSRSTGIDPLTQKCHTRIEAISKLGFWFKVKAEPSFPALRDFRLIDSLLSVTARRHTEVCPQWRGKGPAPLPKTMIQRRDWAKRRF
jgi:hypothetical protein